MVALSIAAEKRSCKFDVTKRSKDSRLSSFSGRSYFLNRTKITRRRRINLVPNSNSLLSSLTLSVERLGNKHGYHRHVARALCLNFYSHQYLNFKVVLDHHGANLV